MNIVANNIATAVNAIGKKYGTLKKVLNGIRMRLFNENLRLMKLFKRICNPKEVKIEITTEIKTRR